MSKRKKKAADTAGENIPERVPRRVNDLSDTEIMRALLIHGTISGAARYLGQCPTMLVSRVRDTPALRMILDDYRQTIVDDAETALHGAVQRGENWAVTFALRTVGRRRGYVEREQTAARVTSSFSLADILNAAESGTALIESERQQRLTMEQTDTVRLLGDSNGGR